MSKPSQPIEEKHTTPVSLAIDAILVAGVFAFFVWILRAHVQSNDPKMIWFWAAMAASCLTGVFWLALQMFRVTLRAQLAANKK